VDPRRRRAAAGTGLRTALCSLSVRSFTAAPARAARLTRMSAPAPIAPLVSLIKFRYRYEMRIEAARIAAGLLQQRRGEFMSAVSLSVRGTISSHLKKSPGFRATKPGSERYLDFRIGFAEDGTSWYFPSRQW
jgi:hypothetical protein